MTDELDQIHQALQDSGVYVHPELADEFTADQLVAIEQQAAAYTEPVYVVAFPLRGNDAYAGNPADLLTRLHAAHPEPGVYLSTTTSLRPTDYTSIRLEGRQWGIPGEADGDLGSFRLLAAVGHEDHDSLGAAFERATELLAAGPDAITEAYDTASAQAREDYESTTGQDGGPGGGAGDGFDPTGLLIATLVVAVLGALGRTAIRRIGRRSPGGGTPRPLPPSAMARIRQAHDRRLEERARADLLALGEAIDATEIGPGHDRDSWQAALDHYDAARRFLDPDPGRDVLDVVGAVVLADRGRAALAAASRGRAYEPAAPCFLNPLHGRATSSRSVELDGRAVTVPLCAECRAALSKQRVPDILDVERGGRPLHYFETDDEPWASSGYGALEPDLLRLLNRRE